MIGKTLLRAGALAAAAALPLSLVATSGASAAPAKPKTATVTVLHAIPGSVLAKAGIAGGVVDVCANGTELLNDVAPGAQATVKVPPGDYTLTVHAGAGGCATPAAIQATASVVAGKNYTVAAYLAVTFSGLTPTSAPAPALKVFDNNIAALPKPKNSKNAQGRVTVRHLAVAPAVDIVVNGAVAAALSPVNNGEEKQTAVKKGTYQVAAGPTGIATTAIALGPVPLQVRQGWNVIAYAWGIPTSAGGEGTQVALQYVKLNLPKK